MQLYFPAMRGHMGKRDYYVTMVKLSLVPKLFQFQEWAGVSAELRAQRVLQKSRIPEITQYIIDNEDGYLFSSLTASYDCEADFKPFEGRTDIGILEIPLEASLVINDGQHRRAAIEEALQQNPMLANETISVVLFPYEDLTRMQQMFSDLNRTPRTTSKSLNVLYNHRDLMSQIARRLSEAIDVFKGMVDKDHVSLGLRSSKLFTLASIYDATTALLGAVLDADFDKKVGVAIEFWEHVAANMIEWQKVRDRDLKPAELRQEFICTHAVLLWALGAMGQTLVSAHPTDWQSRLAGLRKIDWRRTNREWQGVAMSGKDVVNRRQNRMDTASFLKVKLALNLTPAEDRSLKGATDLPSILDELKKFTGSASSPEA